MSVDNSLILHRAQCKRMLSILYFRLKQINILENTVNATLPVNPFVFLIDKNLLTKFNSIKGSVTEINKEYEKADHQVLTEVVRKLEDHFTQLQKMQNELAVILKLFSGQEELVDAKVQAAVFQPFAAVQMGVSSISAFNQSLFRLARDDKPITNEQLQRYKMQEQFLESKLEAFGKTVAEINEASVQTSIEDAFLTHFFTDSLAEAIQQQLRTLFLTRWQKEITNRGGILDLKYPEKNLQRVLKVKELFNGFKLQFCQAFYGNSLINARARHELFKRTVSVITFASATTGEISRSNPQQIFSQLEMAEQSASDTVESLEAGYQDYTWTQGVLTALARLVTKTPYYEFSENFLILAEELTDNQTGIYPCDIKLDDDIFGVFATVGAVGLAGVTGYASHQIDVRIQGSYSLFSLSIEALRANLNSSIFYWGNKLGCNSARVVQALPKLRTAIGAAAVGAACALAFGFYTPEMASAITGYVIGTSASDLSNTLLLSMQQSNSSSNKKRRVFTPLVSGLLGLGTVYAACTLTGVEYSLAELAMCSFLGGNLCREIATLPHGHLQPQLTRLMHRAFDTKRLLDFLPTLSFLSGLTAVVGFTAVTEGTHNIIFVTGSYLLGAGCQALASRGVDYAKKRVVNSKWVQQNFSVFIQALPNIIGLTTTFAISSYFEGMHSSTTRCAIFTYIASTSLASLSKWFNLPSSTANNIGTLSIIPIGMILEPKINMLIYPIIGNTVNTVCGYVIESNRTKKLSKSCKQQLERCMDFLWMIPKHAAFIVGSSYLAPSVHAFFKNTYNKLFRPPLTWAENVQLLTNTQECSKDVVECKRAAYAVLDLPVGTSLVDAKKRHREIMRDVHPDMIEGHEQEAAEYNAAIVVLSGLNND